MKPTYKQFKKNFYKHANEFYENDYWGFIWCFLQVKCSSTQFRQDLAFAIAHRDTGYMNGLSSVVFKVSLETKCNRNGILEEYRDKGLIRVMYDNIYPVTVTQADIINADPRYQVIWDQYAFDMGEVRQGSLADADRRARYHRLDWSKPLQRAIAERLPSGHTGYFQLG